MVNALDYLADYPYGCTEQTLSRFVPAVITAKVLQQLGIRKPDLEKKLPDMIRAGLDRLEDFQHGDGGWGWWKEGESDLYMTAYVVQGLAQALEADAPVKRETIARAERYLAENLIKAQDQPRPGGLHFFTPSRASRIPPPRRHRCRRPPKSSGPSAKNSTPTRAPFSRWPATRRAQTERGRHVGAQPAQPA